MNFREIKPALLPNTVDVLIFITGTPQNSLNHFNSRGNDENVSKW